jgi:arsenate reductase
MENKKTHVLFICDRNAARGQMAEAFLNHLGGDRFHAESAGFDPVPILPEVITAMKEKGIDLAEKKSDSVLDYYAEGRIYKYVISMCDEKHNERCPVFPGITAHYYWTFEAPHLFEGGDLLSKVREVRDGIEQKILEWIKEH